MDLKFEFYVWQPSNIKYFMVSVEEPYDHMSTMFEGQETSQQITQLISEAEKIQAGELERGGIANNAGFDSNAFSPIEDYPEGGLDVYNYFDKNHGEEPIYTIPLPEYLKILKEFKVFLEENGR